MFNPKLFNGMKDFSRSAIAQDTLGVLKLHAKANFLIILKKQNVHTNVKVQYFDFQMLNCTGPKIMTNSSWNISMVYLYLSNNTNPASDQMYSSYKLLFM